VSESVLPAQFLARLRALHDDETYALVEDSFSRPHRTAFRVNTLLGTVDEARSQLAADAIVVERGPQLFSDAFILGDEAQREALTHGALATSGKIYLQTLSSLLPPTLLGPSPDDEVLDLAAAPGGKTIHIAGLMENRGRIAAVEPSRDRFFRLRANLERAGVDIAELYMHDGARVGDKVPERFTHVLLDAPCSTEARFKSDDARTLGEWSEKKVARLAKLQARLLSSGLRALKPGGRLVYSTCSYAPEENEGVIASALEKFRDRIRVVPIALDLENAREGLTHFDGDTFPDDVRGTRRILPMGAFEASYVAVLEKTDPFDDDAQPSVRDRQSRRRP
jgi:16S rRNA C967 or C1407 C5-methylase (RsmB/RsmF family)